MMNRSSDLIVTSEKIQQVINKPNIYTTCTSSMKQCSSQIGRWCCSKTRKCGKSYGVCELTSLERIRDRLRIFILMLLILCIFFYRNCRVSRQFNNTNSFSGRQDSLEQTIQASSTATTLAMEPHTSYDDFAQVTKKRRETEV